MCFNSKVSILTGTLGVVFSILLYNKGDKRYNIENKIFGLLNNHIKSPILTKNNKTNRSFILKFFSLIFCLFFFEKKEDKPK